MAEATLSRCFLSVKRAHLTDARRVGSPLADLPAITFDITSNGASIINGSTTKKNASVSVTASYPDNFVTITVSGPSYQNTKTYTGNCSLALTNLAPGTYSVSIKEEDKGKTNSVSVNASFTVKADQPTPPPASEGTGVSTDNTTQTNP